MLVIEKAKIRPCLFGSRDGTDECFRADILVDDGKILRIAESLAEVDAERIDAEGKLALPGFVDAHSHLGGFDPKGKEDDLNEMSGSSTPQMNALDSINRRSPLFREAIKAGITTSCVSPGSGNVVCGLAVAVKSAGDAVLKNPVAMKMALGGNPKGVYGPRKQLPMTRMGIAHLIREELSRAREYMEKRERDKEKTEWNAGLENLAMVLRHEIPLKIHCEQFDMLTSIRIAKEFAINITLDHAWGASDYYDDIDCPQVRGVIYGPIGVMLLPGEIGKIDIESLIELDRRGVCTAIMTDGPILNPQLLLMQAGELLRFGGDYQRALNMLSINPARILGVDDRVGSLEEGKDADILLFDGDAVLDPRARLQLCLIDGKIEYRDGL